MDTPHIAVVDDDDSVREAIEHLIGVLGYSVDTFASAEAFLNSSRLKPTSCVITDVHMPGMSGIELQRRSDLLISGLRVEGSDRRNSGSGQLVVQKMGFATVDG